MKKQYYAFCVLILSSVLVSACAPATTIATEVQPSAAPSEAPTAAPEAGPLVVLIDNDEGPITPANYNTFIGFWMVGWVYDSLPERAWSHLHWMMFVLMLICNLVVIQFAVLPTYFQPFLD